MLNPVRALKGKLNYLKVPNSHLYKLIQLANSVPVNAKSSLDSVSLDQINALQSTPTLNTKDFYRFLFEFQCHNENRFGTVSNSIFEELIPEERKVVSLISKFVGRLNARQLAYLNLKVRENIDSQVPNWENLHLNNDSPSKRDILLLPTLRKSALQHEIKSLPKKNVAKIIKSFH
jgi:hypothetical protein